MSWEGILALVASGVTLVGLLLSYLGSSRANKTNEKKQASESQLAALTQNLELTRYIDQRVEEKVAPIREQLARQQTIYTTMKNTVGKVWQRIAAQWPAGHPVPELDPADIEGIEDTIPTQWLPGGAPKRA